MAEESLSDWVINEQAHEIAVLRSHLKHIRSMITRQRSYKELLEAVTKALEGKLCET